MSLWWLEPGWKDAECLCGANIWQAGGDPDMGCCPDCAQASQEPPQAEPPAPPCDICGEHEAVAGANGYGVCSEECDKAARTKAEALKLAREELKRRNEKR